MCINGLKYTLKNISNVNYNVQNGKVLKRGNIILKQKYAVETIVLALDLYCILYSIKPVAIDTPGGKRNLKMKIKAQQMTFRQDITKYKMYWITFRCIVHNIFRAIKLIYKRVLYIYK
jgi:hypothetical protein